MSDDAKPPPKVWVVGTDTTKVEFVRAAVAEDGYTLETMDAATAMRRLEEGEEPVVIVQFTRVVGNLRFVPPEHKRRLQDRIVPIRWIALTPEFENYEAWGDCPWDLLLSEPFDLAELRSFVHRLVASWQAVEMGNISTI